MSHTRVRFAPSPTGYLHVGGARTLLFNWLYAKKTGGTLVLRIEDTDQQRSTRQSEQMILSDMARLGLDYEEGPDRPGEFAPYRQSERLSIYAQYARELLAKDQVYYCFCSDELLTQKREAALKLGRMPHYDGTCAHLPKDQVAERLARGEKAGLRFRAPHRSYVLEDHVRGRVEFKEGMVGDFLITRTPASHESEIAQGIGFPVYNFCCVVDDHLMKMTHVIRAEEHLSNTVRQLMIYEAFGWKTPEFAHIALVLGQDRQKLSKRSGDVSVYEYLDQGYLPEALLNFLVLLGWSPSGILKTESGHPEILSRNEMIQVFDLQGLQKAAAVFDLQKLKWMNSYYIRNLPLAEIVERSRPFFKKTSSKLQGRSEQWFSSVIEIVRAEVQLLSELPAAAELFLESMPGLEPQAQEVLKESSSGPVVEALIAELMKCGPELTASDVDALMKTVGVQTQARGKALFMPIRSVITGKTHGPELKLVLPLLGRDSVLKRIEGLRNQVGQARA
ncbi:MAG: glutamate--tRNA ligase [Bdellovibrionia bacterium]